MLALHLPSPSLTRWFSLAILSTAAAVPCNLLAQEPTAALKQADADYREGVAALNRRDLKTARAKFEKVVSLAPTAEQGHSALGAVLVQEGEMDAGIRELQKALAIKPGESTAQTNLAVAYQQTGAAAKALLLFAKLDASANAEKHSLEPPVLESYALALAAGGQSSKAILKMNQAIAGDSANPKLLDELGSLYAQSQDWRNAERAFSAALERQPDYAMAHLHLGFVYQTERKPEAADQWAQAYKSAPSDPWMALAAGKALSGAGQDRQALPILEQAHRLNPKSTEAAYQLGLVLQRIDRVQDAIPLLNSVVEAEPRNADALINLGMALSQAHQAKDGVPFLQRGIALRPQDPTAHQNLAAAYLQINQISDAITELKSALKLSPDSPQMHYDLGVAYKLQDDATNAIPELETAARLDRNAYEPAFVLGQMYMQVGRYAEAAPQLEASLKLHPENGDAWAMLGSVYNKLDRLPDAVSALHEAIRQLPDQADPHLTLAAVLVKMHQPEDAAAERKEAANLMRAHMNFQRAEVATNSGKSLLSSGDIDGAIHQFQDALGFDPNYAEAHRQLATALEKQGKSAEAAAERAKAASEETPKQ